ncbi:MAG: N-acetylmuramoyl-L-alanine amidase [Acidobacteriota bacterium]|nr:MAG: N-acetylmuramoyl-L-alanine amidase [Acidobacteriota bacterium]
MKSTVRQTSWYLLVLLALTALACPKHPDYRKALLPPGLAGGIPEIDESYLLEIDQRRIDLTREYLRIHQPETLATLPAVDSVEGISFVPQMVVVHFTDIPTLEETLEYFRPVEIEAGRPTIKANGLLNVGVQFIIDPEGRIYRSYPETVIARHTIGLNHVAIGIENVGTGDLGDRSSLSPLTNAQVWANVQLIAYLAARHPSIRYVIAHSEYRDVEAPEHPAHRLFLEKFQDYRTEKIDPGERFMAELRRNLAQEAVRGEQTDSR